MKCGQMLAKKKQFALNIDSDFEWLKQIITVFKFVFITSSFRAILFSCQATDFGPANLDGTVCDDCF